MVLKLGARHHAFQKGIYPLIICLDYSVLPIAFAFRPKYRFKKNRKTADIHVTGPLYADQGDTLVEFAVSGAGVVLIPE